MLKALPGYALIEIEKQYESGLVTDKEKYASNSKGKLLEVSLIEPKGESRWSNYIGKTVYFARFEDGEVIKDDGREFVFVRPEMLRGVKYDA